MLQFLFTFNWKFTQTFNSIHMVTSGRLILAVELCLKCLCYHVKLCV